MHIAPDPTPCRIRATYTVRRALATTIGSSQPSATCASLTINDTRRPNTEHAAPAANAPTANNQLTVAIDDGASAPAAVSFPGDDRPSTVPTTNAPSDATRKQRTTR